MFSRTRVAILTVLALAVVGAAVWASTRNPLSATTLAQSNAAVEPSVVSQSQASEVETAQSQATATESATPGSPSTSLAPRVKPQPRQAAVPTTKAAHGPKVVVARGFYVDCTAGSDGAAGTSVGQAWKSLAKAEQRTWGAGEALLLKRGCSWNGGLALTGRGTAGKPAAVMPYGSGAAPALSNTGDAHDGSIIAASGSHVVIDGLKLHNALRAGVATQPGSANITMRNLEITQTGFGVYLRGANHLVVDNKAHDLKMVKNTPGGDDDHGAVGYNVEGTGMEIAYNSCINCRAPSYDYGNDGGFVEVWNDGDNLYVHHNVARNTDGFFELGAEDASHHANNIRVEYNRLEGTAGSALNVHQSAKFQIGVKNMVYANNTAVGATAHINFPGAGPDQLTLRNNTNIRTY